MPKPLQDVKKFEAHFSEKYKYKMSIKKFSLANSELPAK